MAPEQLAEARSVDIRADIYSLGCTLYKLLAGRPPFGMLAAVAASRLQAAELVALKRQSFPSKRGIHMDQRAFQDYYPDEVSHCYGCGRLNEQGLKVKSYWDGEETVAIFHPKPYHMAVPGYVYGGLLASVVDCHGTGTAAAAAYRAEHRAMDTQPPIRFLTASLHVDYVCPTPLGVPLEIRGKVKEIRKRPVDC